LGLVWSGRRIPRNAVHFERGSFSFRIPARWMEGRTRHDLVVLARERSSTADPRRLGLPVFAVEVRPLRAEAPLGASAARSKELAAA
jgi:hypothetical protein